MEKQRLPLQIAPILFCFLITADRPRPGGPGAAACRAARRPHGGCPPAQAQSRPSAHGSCGSTAVCGEPWGAGAPLSSATATCPSTKLHGGCLGSMGWAHSTWTCLRGPAWCGSGPAGAQSLAAALGLGLHVSVHRLGLQPPAQPGAPAQAHGLLAPEKCVEGPQGWAWGRGRQGRSCWLRGAGIFACIPTAAEVKLEASWHEGSAGRAAASVLLPRVPPGRAAHATASCPWAPAKFPLPAPLASLKFTWETNKKKKNT